MNQRLRSLRKQTSEAAGRLSAAQSSRDLAAADLKKAQVQQRLCRAAVSIVTVVGESLQRRVSDRLSSVASHALSSIFPNPYEVKVHFTPTGRGTIEAQILFCRDGQEFRPVLPSGQLLAGGGPVEVAAWGLRVALWGQRQRHIKTRPVMLMDEPFRFLSEDLHSVAGTVLREIAGKTGIQFLLVTHDPPLVEGANLIDVEEARG